MSEAARKIMELAKVLSEGERAEVATALMDSLRTDREKEIEEYWIEEAMRRMKRVESGAERTIPWEEARKELSAKREQP